MARRKHWTTVVPVDGGYLVACDCGNFEQLVPTTRKGEAVEVARSHQVAAEYAERMAVAW
jgi:hypothetical protein